MPCCTARIDFLQCGCTGLYRVGCDATVCAEFCPPSDQRVILKTNYAWECIDCHTKAWANTSEARSAKWERRADALFDTTFFSETAKAEMVDTMREKQRLEEFRRDERHLGQVQEIEDAGIWTYRFGILARELLYGDARGERREEVIQELVEVGKCRPWDLLIQKNGLSRLQALSTSQRASLELFGKSRGEVLVAELLTYGFKTSLRGRPAQRAKNHTETYRRCPFSTRTLEHGLCPRR